MKIIFNYLIPFILILWIIGFTFPVLINYSNHLIVYLPFIKLIYSPVCHQIPERSFEINNLSFLVCIRCTGIYLGIFVSYFFLLISNFEFNLSKKLFLFSVFLMAIDVLLYSTGVYNYNKIIAFLTGIFAGITLILFIFPIIKNYFIKKN